jgi:hypothetical protein
MRRESVLLKVPFSRVVRDQVFGMPASRSLFLHPLVRPGCSEGIKFLDSAAKILAKVKLIEKRRKKRCPS